MDNNMVSGYNNNAINNAYTNQSELKYLDLLHRAMIIGEKRDGRNGGTLSLFGEHITFNVRDEGFPLLTTKRVFWKGVVEELLWFLKGSTNANELSDKGVHIWDGNTSREFLDSRGLTDYPVGECGPIYGYQWRRFNGDENCDQLRFILKELIDNPHGRRAFLSAWNPCQMDKMCLPPCHVSYQWYRGWDGLSCQLYARSQDLFLGTPFNIASTALFTSILAYVIGVPVSKIHICMGDAHVYSVHIDAVKEQLERTPRDYPVLRILKPRPTEWSSIDEAIKWIEELRFEDFELFGYTPLPTIKAPMVA